MIVSVVIESRAVAIVRCNCGLELQAAAFGWILLLEGSAPIGHVSLAAPLQ